MIRRTFHLIQTNAPAHWLPADLKHACQCLDSVPVRGRTGWQIKIDTADPRDLLRAVQALTTRNLLGKQEAGR